MKKLRQRFNNLTIRKKLIVLLCLVGFFPVALLGVYIVVNSHKAVVTNRKEDMSNSLKLACASVNNQMAICEQMMRYFVYTPNVSRFLECNPEEKTERYGYYQELRSAISALQYQNFTIQSITIYSQGISQAFGNEAKPLALLEEESWFDRDLKEKQWYIDGKTEKMINLYKIPSYFKVESYTVVRIDKNTLFQGLSQLTVGNSGVSVYYDGEEIWSVVSGNTQERNENSDSFQRNKNAYIWTEEEIENLGVTVIYFQPKDNIQMISWEMLVGILLEITICLVIILILGWKFSNYISKPLELLTFEIQNMDENEIVMELESEQEDETGILIRSYNQMMKRIRELIQENYETRIAQKEFEMKALQAQINPHFLYNSLSIINWKAIEAGAEEISHVTLALSSFYRTTLNKGNTMISIRMALENIQSYLKIQLLMHDDDFKVHYEIDKDTFTYMIPSLIFQPFVENSLEHGLDVKEDLDHQLWICIRQDKQYVYVEIRDNGVGMDAETLEHILEYKAIGYGIKNVNDRMILHYGKAYGIHIESWPDKGTNVMLRFPKNHEGKSEYANKI